MRRTSKIIVWLITAVIVGWFGYVFVGPNQHTVLAGKVYRSAQPSRSRLESQLRNTGIRTVLNLRGYCPDFDWYRDEVTAIADAGANLEDVTLSAKCLPSPGEIRRIIDVFDHSEYPILIHCKEGKDRTGLAAVMVKLLYTDATLAQAKRELWPIWGHFRVVRTAAMDDFFDRYERWLAERPHSPALFREWATVHYIAGVGRSEIAFVDGPPKVVNVNTAPKWTVRVTNRSADTWYFTPGSTASVHLGYALYHAGESKPIFEEKAGLFRKVLKVGLSVDLTVALPPLRTRGRYMLKLEMLDYMGAAIPDRATPFTKYGDDPLLVEFEVQ